MAEKLFGTLHTPLKPINYNVKDSDSINLTIDNSDRIITAEITPKILDRINANRTALDLAYDKIVELSNELKELENQVNETTRELLTDIGSLESITSVLSVQITDIQENYPTSIEVKQWIDEARFPEGSLLQYVKHSELETVVTELETAISHKLEQETFNSYKEDTNEQLSELNEYINQVKSDLEHKISDLPENETLWTELHQTFTTEAETEQLITNKLNDISIISISIEDIIQ